jgi:DNA replication protein DnaC
LADRKLVSAVSNIKQRSERQPDVNMLRRTPDVRRDGVFPQLNNANNQILYGRRGTGKSHVLRILEVEASAQAGTCTVCIDYACWVAHR